MGTAYVSVVVWVFDMNMTVRSLQVILCFHLWSEKRIEICVAAGRAVERC